MTLVGKPAPPRPTMPDSLIAFNMLSLSGHTGGTTLSWISWSPSGFISTATTSMPLEYTISRTSATVPETLEWTGADIGLSESPIFWPTRTLSPF